VKSINAWLDVAKYAIKEFDPRAAGLEVPDPEREIEKALGPDWKKAIDPARPLAFAAAINADNLTDSPVLVLVPVVDPEALLALLRRTGAEAEKDGDLHRFSPPGLPFPVYLRFANKYAYLSPRDGKPLAKEMLPAPEKVFTASDAQAELAVRVHIDR